MIQSKIVARAVCNGGAYYPTREEPTPYEFKKGEVGVLSWHEHRDHPDYYQPLIVWDNDPAKAKRPILLTGFEFIGIQIGEAARVLFQPL